MGAMRRLSLCWSVCNRKTAELTVCGSLAIGSVCVLTLFFVLCLLGAEFERLKLTEPPSPRFVRHDGYVSLFPFLLDVLPANDDRPLASALRLMRDPERMRSPCVLWL
jgi:hypothetical protein